MGDDLLNHESLYAWDQDNEAGPDTTEAQIQEYGIQCCEFTRILTEVKDMEILDGEVLHDASLGVKEDARNHEAAIRDDSVVELANGPLNPHVNAFEGDDPYYANLSLSQNLSLVPSYLQFSFTLPLY